MMDDMPTQQQNRSFKFAGSEGSAFTSGEPQPMSRMNLPPKDRNMIYVGKKESMAYVLAVVTQFNDGNAEIHLKARGRSISKAIDITQIVKNRFLPNAQIKKIDVSTEELPSEDGRMSKVSCIDITMSKE